MTESFAGARSMDERRRRRLATETGASDASAVSEATRKRRARRGKGVDSSRRRRASHFPLRKLISARFWKIWGVGTLAMAVGAGLLAGTWGAMERPELLGPGLARYFEPSSGRVNTYFNTFLLISSAQLAFLIWWVRSRSLHDFSARYRVWAWAGSGGFAAAASLSTGAHIALSETVEWLWDVDFPHKQTWFWMAPALLWGLLTLQFLRREMRECRGSLTLLWLSAFCFGALAAGQFFEIPASLLERIPAPRAFLEISLMTLACCLMFQSMLLHARHVIYTSVEPPAERESRFQLRRLFGFGRKTAERAVSTRTPRKKKKKAPARSATKRRTDSAEKAGDVPTSLQSQTAAATSNSGQRITPPHTAHPKQSNKPHHEPSEETERVRSSETVRSAGNSMRGLSKKERKRLRQLEREERRSRHAV